MSVLLSAFVLLFPVGVFLRKLFPDLCALCFAASLAWVFGLTALFIGDGYVGTVDAVSLGIFMGGSAVGSMYFIFSKLSEVKQLFKLPFLVTLFALVYAALTFSFSWLSAAGIAALWLAFFLLYVGRTIPQLTESIQRIIACCKNW